MSWFSTRSGGAIMNERPVLSGIPSSTNVEGHQHGRVLVIRLNRPEKHNAITSSMRTALIDIFRWASESGRIGAVVLEGAGRSFCAGQDLKEPRKPEDHVPSAIWRREAENIATSIEYSSIPVIAALHGAVLGRGLDIALACDIRIVAPDTSLGLPEVLHGMVLGGGGTRRLARLVGQARAAHIILTGEPINAQRALEWGLATVEESADRLHQRAMELAETLADRSESALLLARMALRGSHESSLLDGAWTDTAFNVLMKHGGDQTAARQP